MAIFPLPTAASILADSRLTVDEISAAFGDTATAKADIEQRIADEVASIETDILEHVTAAEWAEGAGEDEEEDAADYTRRNRLATNELRLRVLSSLFESAGFLNDGYEQKADRYTARADKVRAQLMGDLQSGADLGSDGTQGAATLSTAAYTLDSDLLPVVNGSYYA
jgi:hypothetical protein